MSNADKSAKAVLLAKKNLVNFRKILLSTGKDECKAAPFHYDWSDKLLYGKGNKAIEGFRESAKGQLVLRSFPLYCLTFPDESRDFIVIIKATKTQARDKLKEIEREYLSNPIISANYIKIHDQSGDVFSVDVRDPNNPEGIINIRIAAYGKGESIRGLVNIDRRPKICIIDDPQDITDSRSETIMEHDWDWFLADVCFLGQYTRIFLIGNNLGMRCMIERVMANHKELGFDVERVACASEDYTESTWSAKYTIEEIMTEKANFTAIGKLETWLREKMCQASSEETRIIVDEDYCWYSPSMADTIAANAESVDATLDPASSTQKAACFRAIVVKARMKDGHWYILEIPYGRWDSIELIDKIFQMVTRWGIRRFGIEKGMLQQTYEPLLYREMSLRNIRFALEPLEHGKIGNKLDRIVNIQPRFKAKTVWFPDNAYWLEEFKSEIAGVTKTEIKSEFIDLVDALAMHDQWQDSYHVSTIANEKQMTNQPRMAIR